GHQGQVREDRGDRVLVRAAGRGRVRQPAGAGVLHGRRDRRRRREREEAPGLSGSSSMLNISVISPEAVLYEGTADSVVAPAFDGEVGILTGHAPMMALLGKGVLRLERDTGQRRFNVEGGFLQVVDNAVRVVTEKATSA